MRKIFTTILSLTLFCLILTSFGGCGKKISAADLEGIVFEDMTVTYDGSEKNLLAVNLPEGVSVVYEGNGKINVGQYTVKAKFYDGDKLLLEKSATLTIVPFTLSGISFEDMTFDYDGEAKSIFVSGTIPDDIRVIYEGNGKTDIGSDGVIARFESDNEN